MTTTSHHLPESLFAALGEGAGGAAAIERLQDAQVSKHLLLIGHLLRQWPGADPQAAVVADALERARAAAPESFRAVVGAPLVGAWAGIAARAVTREAAARNDFLHLGALAVVAGAAAGVPVEAEVPVHAGLAVLPGLGAAEVGDAPVVRAVTEGGRITVVAGDRTIAVPVEPGSPGEHWLPVRRLTGDAAGQRIVVTLDDLHPYRHGHHVPPAARLTDAEVAQWQELFDQAWALLAERLPVRAAELAAGLRTLVPLRMEQGTARSATIRHAFGVFGLTRPPSPAEFAVTAVHEFQHSKLSALLDLVPLTDPDDQGRYFAPWRRDARPLAGLLQGVYAFAGVSDTWRALRGAPIDEDATAEFAATRLQVDRGLTAIERSGALTPAGEALVARLRVTTDALLAEPLPAGVAEEAEAALDRIHRAWVDHNDQD